MDTKIMMSDWLDVIARGAFDEWPERVAEDVVLKLPYAPPGVPAELRGFRQARDALSSVWNTKKSFAWFDVVIRSTDDPDLVVATCRSEVLLASGKRYANDYVIFTRFRDGKVLEHTEYFNPLRVIESFGGQPG